MASNRDQAGHLAQILSERAGVPVTVRWEPAGVAWWVFWTDGPARDDLRAVAGAQARFLAPLEVTRLRWSRDHTPRAWANALITTMRAADPPVTDWRDLIGRAEAWLSDVGHPDRTDDPATATLADRLLTHDDGRESSMARALLATVAKPGDETVTPAPGTGRTVTQPGDVTGCPVCGAPVPTAASGRPGRYCSPACRTRAWRQRHPSTPAVTQPGDVTGCPVCGAPVPTAASGRPGRYCSPACRTRAWRARHAAVRPATARAAGPADGMPGEV